MYTRKDYLAGNCTHEEYYSQFVTDDILSLVKNTFGVGLLEESLSKDEHLNNIPLGQWDNLTGYLPRYVSAGFKNVGDYLTLAGGVCLLKTAAKIVVKNYHEIHLTGV